MLYRLFLLFLIIFIKSCTTEDEGMLEKLFKRYFEQYLKTGQRSAVLNKIVDKLDFSKLYNIYYKSKLRARLLCLACKLGVGAIIFARKKGMSKDSLANLAMKICTLFKMGPVHFCRGLVSLNEDIFLFIIDNKPGLTSKAVCSVLLHNINCEASNAGRGWTIDIPERKRLPDVKKFLGVHKASGHSSPRSLRRSYRQHCRWKQREPSSKATPLKVLQLTDIHYDPNYTVGSNAACGEYVCCQKGTKPATASGTAGYWGAYRCDLPWAVYINCLKHIVTQHKKLDYIYYTGDTVDHRIWETSIASNKKSTTKVLDLLKTHFHDIPIFPILGNHETHPVNLFSPYGINSTNLSSQWVFSLAAKEWKKWLPKSTRKTILKGGYYTALVRKGFRIIALNSNVCFTFNWWLIYDDYDQYGQLQWLVNVLQKAENNGERVHILSHVPTADDTCWFNWAREYSRIVKRFSNTIAAQFNGHTHTIENVIYFDSKNLTKPVNVAFNGGSLTTHHDVNPNYVIYDIDPITADVLDYELWMYDIAETNKKPKSSPAWYKLYSFKEAYGADGLRPNDMAKLVTRLIGDKTLSQQYFRYKFRNATPSVKQGCDDACHLWDLCYMVRSYSRETSQCEEVKKLWKAAKKKNRKLA